MKTTIILYREYLGRGSDELEKTLTGSFIRKIWASDKKPDTIIFYYAVLNLHTEKLLMLDALSELSKAGLHLVLSMTCLCFYEIENKIVIGRVIDIMEIVSLLMAIDMVITP